MFAELLIKLQPKNVRFSLFCASFFMLFCLNLPQAEAQNQQRLEQTIQKNICPNPVTENEISQTQITQPSIWWAKQRFGTLLLDYWFTCPAKQRVYLIVNRQIWNSLNYIDRYEFVNHFGIYSRRDRYNLEVLNPQLEPLATYKCDYNLNPISCNLWVESFGK
ncbi:MAG TPA: hypothetical protein VIQ31_18750 [Phormidium sp.]